MDFLKLFPCGIKAVARGDGVSPWGRWASFDSHKSIGLPARPPRRAVPSNIKELPCTAWWT